jgi:hypothetical protein
METFGVNEAREMVRYHHKEYLSLLEKIKSATYIGEEDVIVPKITSFEIRAKITALGFNIEHKGDNDFIYWGI